MHPDEDDAAEELIGGTVESDTVYRFAGWLSTREEPITFSATHDAAPAAEACAEYLASRPSTNT